MKNSADYKQKYDQLKMKYMQDVDVAFRLGFEQGMVQAQQDAQVQQQQMQQEQAQQGQPESLTQGQGSKGSPAGEEQQANPNGGKVTEMEPDADGSELDKHISELESMISKSENPTQEILETLAKIKETSSLAKSYANHSGIVKDLHKPSFKLGVQASHNMSENAKVAVNMQEKIVSEIMQSWQEEEAKASKSITNILSVEGLIGKE